MKAPAFWYQPENRPTYASLLLWPVSWVWAAVTARRVARPPAYTADVPVICIGNVTVGGTGKTPASMRLADMLKARGHKPVFLTRGYGGKKAGPLLVDPARHDAEQVGDEPLLLCRVAPTVVAHARAKGAQFIDRETDATVIIMDDGLQNPSVKKDVTFLVVDGQVGFGNNKVMPAGPLREPVYEAVERVQGLILVGEKADHVRLPDGAPVCPASIVADKPGWLTDQPVLAFAGIGRPKKFFDSLRSVGASLAGAVEFPDHHPFSLDDEKTLRQTADRFGALLVTTEKDHVRLSPTFRAQVETLPVNLQFDEDDAVMGLIENGMQVET